MQQTVQNPCLWGALLTAMYGSDRKLRVKTLNDISSLLVNKYVAQISHTSAQALRVKVV